MIQGYHKIKNNIQKLNLYKKNLLISLNFIKAKENYEKAI